MRLARAKRGRRRRGGGGSRLGAGIPLVRRSGILFFFLLTVLVINRLVVVVIVVIVVIILTVIKVLWRKRKLAISIPAIDEGQMLTSPCPLPLLLPRMDQALKRSEKRGGEA
jgi:hypothetical protein